MANHWTGIVSAAAPEFVKGSLDKTIRKRLWMSMLNKRGLVRTGVDGSYEREYDVDYKEPPVTSFGFGGQATYEARDYLKRAKMGWRGYIATDEMHVKEYKMLKNSTHNLVNRYNKIVPKLVTGMQNKFGREFYIDGGAAGNTERFEGIETLCGSGGTVTAADIIVEPDDSYHSLDTDLHQAGTWTSDETTKPNAAFGYDWPDGSGDPEFDYNSPLLVKWDGSGWGGDSTSWEDQCIACIRRTAQWMRQSAGLEGDTLLLMLAGHLMTDFKAANDSKIRVLTPHREAEDLGFPDVLNFEGVGIQSEWGVPTNTGYMVAIDNVKLDFITDDMIETMGPVFNEESMSHRFNALSFGNFTFSAKHVAKLYPFATT